MSKINKIRLSGTTYEIEDSEAIKTVELTQAQYDALVSGGTIDPNTFYVITDAEAADLSQYWTSAQTQSAITEATSGKVDVSTYETYTAATDTALSGKQDTLIAGSGITIDSANTISCTVEGGGMSEDDELLLATALVDLNERKLDTSEFKSTLSGYQKKGDYVTSGQLETKLSEYETALDEQNIEEVAAYALNDLNEKLKGKQDTLSAGTNITIVDNVISAEGGSITIDPSLDSGSTNAVANSAITEALEGKLDASAYTPTDLSEYWTSAETQSAITNAVSGKADSSDVYTRTASNYRYMSGASITSGATYDRLYMNKGDGMTNTVAAYFGKINSLPIATKNSSAVNNFTLTEESAFTAHTGDSTIHVTSADKTAWNAKSDFSGSYNDLTDKPTIPTSASQLTNDEGYITSDALSGYAESSAVTEEIAAAVSGKADTSAVTDSINAATSGKVDTTTFETYSGSVETALSGKQDTLSAGTNITISGNVISAEGGGGKAIEAGNGIAITTGATADTVSLDIKAKKGNIDNAIVFNYLNSNVSSGSGSVSFGYYCKALQQYSFANGNNNKASGPFSHAEGNGTEANGESSHSDGEYTKAKGKASHTEGSFVNAENNYESSQGRYNVSSTASTTFGHSGNTLFSVGNGTADNARHNAFEIRQNGDIYIGKGGSDVKLQDIIPSTTSAVTSGSTAVVESGAVYDQLGGMKLLQISQNDYDNLSTKDSSTLYIIVN